MRSPAPTQVLESTVAQLACVMLVIFFSECAASDKSAGYTPGPPNIVLIVADDFGYGDLSSYGATKFTTPNVDNLAANGMRFTDAYVVSSLCSPSRYSILTGRYSWRTRLKKEVLKSFSPPLIEAGRTTVASLLQRQGYFTACVGKWHLGFDWALREDAPQDAVVSVFDSWGTEPQKYIDFSQPLKGGPVERGFDYFFGIPGSNNMIPYVFIENDMVVQPPSVRNDFGAKTLKAPMWDLRTIDQILTEKAVTLIDGHFQNSSSDPLFLYFATSAIHLPCLPVTAKGMSGAGLRGDMVLEFDQMVGAIVDALERNGVIDNTIIIVTSDNGPQPGDPYLQVQRFKSRNWGDVYDFYQPYFDEYGAVHRGVGNQKEGWLTYDHNAAGMLSGFKSDAWEGGLRVPLIAHWPGKIPAGTVNTQVVSTVDFMATFAEIVGTTLTADEGEDSYSFAPALRNSEQPVARQSLVMVSGRSGALAVRKGEWKYIEAAQPEAGDLDYPPPPNEYPDLASPYVAQLYNLSEDIGEKTNLVTTHPSMVSEFRALIQTVITGVKSEAK